MTDKTSKQTQREPDTWILGCRYTDKQKTEIQNHSQSLFRFTYRCSFPPLSPYHYSDDSGWGCMLRSAQMLMGQALRHHLLGRDWRLPESQENRRSNSSYCDIVRWMTDYPGPACIYSIHHLVQCGMLYDKLPGEWYGPSTAALVLRDLARLHRRKYRGPLEIYVTNGDTIYITDVEKTFQSQSVCAIVEDEGTGRRGRESQKQRQVGLRRGNVESSEKEHDRSDEGRPQTVTLPPFGAGMRHSDSDDLTPTAGERYRLDLNEKPLEKTIEKETTVRAHDPFHDPLLNPPPMEQREEWPAALLVIVPLRLGLDRVNPEYIEEIKCVLRNEHTVGIIGGRPNHAIYFAGYRGDYLLGLDPHTTYSNPSLRDPFPSDDHMAQMHQSSLQEMSFNQLDPSLAIAFYFRNRTAFNSFCEDTRAANESKSLSGVSPIFSVQYAPADMEYLGGDMWAGGSDNEGNSDIEDEYVFV